MAGVLVRKVHGWGRVDIDHRVTMKKRFRYMNFDASLEPAGWKPMDQLQSCPMQMNESVRNVRQEPSTWCNDETVLFFILYNFEFRFGTAHHLLSEKDISHTFSRLKLPGTRLFTTQSEYAWFSGLHWDTPSVGNQCRNKKASISCCQPWCLAGFDL